MYGCFEFLGLDASQRVGETLASPATSLPTIPTFLAVLLLTLVAVVGVEPRPLSAHEVPVRPLSSDAVGHAAEPFGSGPASSLPIGPLFCDGRPVSRSRRRKKTGRSPQEIAREKQQLLDKTNSEIDAIAAEYHQKLSRDDADSIGAVYARFSTGFQDSVADQVRAVYADAVRRKIFIPRDHVYFDLATTGRRARRAGVAALQATILQRKVQVVMFLSTSRLFRKAYRAMQFVEEEVVELGVRAIFVSDDLDTSNGENWRMMLQLKATMDEAMTKSHGPHVRAAHESLFRRGMVVTTLPLGYAGEDVPGEFTKRLRPRQRVVVDDQTAPYVRRVFDDYVKHGKTLTAIAQELNEDAAAPPPTRSQTGLWTNVLVRRLLMNEAYCGRWTYGANERKWLSKKDYAQVVKRKQPLLTVQFDHLRIVSVDLWRQAQVLIAKERAKSGRKSEKDQWQQRPRLLRGLFVCPEHGGQLIVSGAGASVLHCRLCRAVKAEDRTLFTHLNRALATQMTCHTLADLVRADDSLVDDIVAACERCAAQAQQPDPGRRRRILEETAKLDNAVTFNRRNPGETEVDQAATRVLLRNLGRRKAEL
ncbi:MAG: recombinase family protein, partial [Planctomycetales bacterium]|nr:recombinase family protein [Planctomycetales bacterium]